MADPSFPRDAPGAELRRVLDVLSRLVREHLELLRAELRDELSRVVRDAGVGVAAVPFLLLALLFGHAAVAALLAGELGWPGALGLVAGFDLVVGGTLGGIAARRLRRLEVGLPETTRELEADRAMLRDLRGPPASHRKALPGDGRLVRQ